MWNWFDFTILEFHGFSISIPNYLHASLKGIFSDLCSTCKYFVFSWLFGFYGISTFVGYLTPNPFYTNNVFYFKQFSLAWVRSLIVKNISISSYSVYSNSSNSANSV